MIDGDNFPHSRKGALERLKIFCDEALLKYETDRNYVRKGHGNVSRLSPCVSCRMISEEEIVSEVLQKHDFLLVEKFIQEVHWRTYWKGWLELRPEIWKMYLSSKEKLKNEMSTQLRKKSEAIVQSRSGVEIVDAWSHELITTGYLHNHVRMWFASYWVHVCGLPWELGAEFFENHLLDADAASNTLSWRWVAGLQTKGKTYRLTAENVARYDWRAESEKYRFSLKAFENCLALQPQWQENQVTVPTSFFQLIEDISEKDVKCIWIHEESLGLKDDFFKKCSPDFVIVSAWRNEDTSQLRKAWRLKVIEDTVARCKQKWRCEIFQWQRGREEKLLIEQLTQRGITCVHCIKPCVGYLRDYSETFEKMLLGENIQLKKHVSTWDKKFWPYAERGFFSFWQQVKKSYTN